ncbi:MAG: hypothetical protein JWQ19_458 [Subtercola sp.]|nr:hypothetical protein [Subtercola sp.]
MGRHAATPAAPSLRAPDEYIEERFTGRIAGFGTTGGGFGTTGDGLGGASPAGVHGPRIVIGMWAQSPYGRFADVMIEHPDARRILLAPSDRVATYVSSTYTFDEVRVVPVRFLRVAGGITVVAGDAATVLDVTLRVGRITPLGRVLRGVPERLATDPRWLRAVDPVAARLVPGAHTSGSAGGGRREYYGVTTIRALDAVYGTLEGRNLGALAPLDPPVTFGFGSAPATPSLVDLTTIIRSPQSHAQSQ